MPEIVKIGGKTREIVLCSGKTIVGSTDRRALASIVAGEQKKGLNEKRRIELSAALNVSVKELTRIEADLVDNKPNTEYNEVMREMTDSERRIHDSLTWMMDWADGSLTVGHTLFEANSPNSNGDMIPEDECTYDFIRSFKGQGCTWDHDQNIFVGAIVNSGLDEETKTAMMVTRFWNARPLLDQYTSEIIDKYQAGQLKFSFEIAVAYAECSICKAIFPAVSDGPDGKPSYAHYCTHLLNKRASGAVRILRDLIPQGEGVVDVPAFKNSKAYVAASEEQEDVKKTINLLDGIEKAISELKNRGRI